MTALSAPKTPTDRAKILQPATSLVALGAGSHSAPRILPMLCSTETCATDVSLVLCKQATLCARVLRVANSAYDRQSRSVTGIDRALSVLGLVAVHGIAAAACIDRSMVRGTGKIENPQRSSIWVRIWRRPVPPSPVSNVLPCGCLNAWRRSTRCSNPQRRSANASSSACFRHQ